MEQELEACVVKGRIFFLAGVGEECWWYICVLMAKINGEGVIKSDGLYQPSKNLRGLGANIWHFLGETFPPCGWKENQRTAKVQVRGR